MSLFGTKKKEISTKPVKAVKVESKKKPAKIGKTDKAIVAVSSNPVSNNFGTADVIIRPRITEKSGILSQAGVYTFEISSNANKNSVANAVKTLYKVQPLKIAIMNVSSKNVFVKGRRGVVSGFRKALVTLKKGDKIDFV